MKRSMVEWDKEMKMLVRDIQKERISLGLDPPFRPVGAKRIMRGMATHQLMSQIKNDLIKKPRQEDLQK